MLERRLLVLCTLVAWAGVTLLLTDVRWFRRAPLAARLAPFAGPGASQGPQRRQAIDLLGLLAPLALHGGERLSILLGASGDLGTRLRRARIDADPTAFRLRQFGWTAAALGLALAVCVAFRPPLPLLALLLLGAPLLAFLVLEQQLASAIKGRQRRLFAELPIVEEQLATLLGAGWSLGAALNRLAERNHGATGEDLRVVRERVRHGLTVPQALREWADLADVAELRRLVAVLSMASETNDLGRLVSDEARSVRRESQRRLAEIIDRRAQQVWVPVTVATLVPGVIFLVVPFLQALRIFSAG